MSCTILFIFDSSRKCRDDDNDGCDCVRRDRYSCLPMCFVMARLRLTMHDVTETAFDRSLLLLLTHNLQSCCPPPAVALASCLVHGPRTPNLLAKSSTTIIAVMSTIAHLLSVRPDSILALGRHPLRSPYHRLFHVPYHLSLIHI